MKGNRHIAVEIDNIGTRKIEVGRARYSKSGEARTGYSGGIFATAGPINLQVRWTRTIVKGACALIVLCAVLWIALMQ